MYVALQENLHTEHFPNLSFSSPIICQFSVFFSNLFESIIHSLPLTIVSLVHLGQLSASSLFLLLTLPSTPFFLLYTLLFFIYTQLYRVKQTCRYPQSHYSVFIITHHITKSSDIRPSYFTVLADIKTVHQPNWTFHCFCKIYKPSCPCPFTHAIQLTQNGHTSRRPPTAIAILLVFLYKDKSIVFNGYHLPLNLS